MNANALLSALFPSFQVDEMTLVDRSILVKAHTTSRVTVCPHCHQPFEKVCNRTDNPTQMPVYGLPFDMKPIHAFTAIIVS